METGGVTIQEPVSSKINIEEAPAGIKVDNVNLSTILDDEITSRDCGNNTILGEAEVENGSGNTETKESEREKGEAMKNILVEEDTKIVKEKASQTEKDEQSSIFVHEPESFNKEIGDAKINLSDVTLEKEDDITQKQEEASIEKAVIGEDQTETEHSPEQEDEISNIYKVLIDTLEIPIKTDEVKEEKDSRSVETSVNGTEAEQKATVSVEKISRNGENIGDETVPEEETATDDVETTKRVLLEVKKEEEEAEPLIKTVVEDANIVSNEETTAHESESFKDNVKPVEAVKNSDDAEKISREVTVDKEKDEEITQNTEEVQKSVRVIETPTIQGEEIESKASLDNEEEIDKISKDTEEHEHVLVRDIPQGETFVTETETVDASTVQEAVISKTNINETEAHSAIIGEEEDQETKKNTKTSQDLKQDIEQEETEMVNTIISSNEVRSSDVQVEEFGEHNKPRSLEIKDESHGREESVEVKTKDTVQEEITEEKQENLLDVASSESEKYQDDEPETSLVTNIESKENFEDIPSDLALSVDKEELEGEKINVDQVDETQIMEEQRDLDSNGAEAEQVNQNRADETEEIHIEKMQKLSLESPSEVSEETSKAIDEKIEDKQERKELGEQANEERFLFNLTPLQEKETKLEKHEPTNEEVKSDEVIEFSSALPSKELEGETVVEAENIKENEEEQAADKIQKSVEIVESHSSLPSSLEEEENGTVSEKIEEEKGKEEEPIVQIRSEDDATTSHERQDDFSKAGEETTVVQVEETRDIEPSLTEKCSIDQSQLEECSGDEQKKEVSRNSENIVNETNVLHSEEAAEEETATNGESLHDVETTKIVLLEVENKEEEDEIKTDAEPSLDVIEKEETETLKTVVEEAKIANNEETTAHEYERLKGDDHHKENTESVEAIKNLDDAEQNRETEEDMTQKSEKVQESSRVIETPTIQEEDIESKASLKIKEEVDQSSKDIGEHEHVLGRDIPQSETLEPETVESKEDTKPSLDKEQELTETTNTVTFSDEVRSSDIQAEVFVENTKPCSSEIKDESHGREESVEVKTKDIVQEETTEEKLLDVASTESGKYQENEPETSLVANTEIKENSEETATNGESVDDAETTKRVLLEVEKVEEEAEMKTDAEPRLDAKEKEENTTHESESLKGDDHLDKNAESVEAIENSDDAEQISREVTVDKETEEDMTQKTEKVQESPRTIETPAIQGEDIESKASLELKEEVYQSSKGTEEHVHVLGREIPQCETLEAEAVEVKEDTKPFLDKEDKEQELTETAKTIIFSDKARPSDQADEFGEHTEPCSLEIKDESHGREESVEEIVQDESTVEKHENILDVPAIESKYQDNEPETSLVANTEIGEKFKEIPSDLVLSIDKEELKDEKINVDQVDGTQILEEQRSLYSSGAEAEQVDQNRADETEESLVAKLVVLPDVESVEQTQKAYLVSPSEVIEEKSKTIDESIEEKSEEETVLVQESKELGEQDNEEKTLTDLTPLQEESSKPNEQDKEIVLEKHEPTNEEVSSESFKGENAESVEAIKNSDDAEQILSEVIGDGEKEEVQESPRVIETPREDIESKASLELKEEVGQSSKDTEEHELVLGRDIPQCDQTLEAEAVDTSTTVQEAEILKNLETSINETEAVHSEMDGAEEGQETKEDTETILDLKEDKEAKEAETLKTVIFSDEVRSSDQVDAQAEELGEDTAPCRLEIKDESQGREESFEVKSKETVQDESSEEKDVNLLDVPSGESEKYQDNVPETSELTLQVDKDELKDDQTKADQVDETQTMDVQRGLDLNEPEAEQVDQNRTDETEETPVEKLVLVEDSGLDETTHNQILLDIESVEKVQKPSLETPEILEETSKTVDEKIKDKPKEEVTLHQEDQEEGSYGLESKEETVSVPEDLCLSNEQENETKLQEKSEPTKEEVSNDQQSPLEETSDEVIQVLSALTSEETVVEAEKIEDKKVDEEEQVAEKIQKSLETVETVEPHSPFQEHESVSEKTDDEKVKEVEPMEDISEKGLEITETTDLSIPSVDQKEDIKALDEEIQIPSVALPLDEQEKVTSTEKEETEANETAEVKKEDEEIIVSTSKTSENVCIQQEEFGKLEAQKLEESKEEDKSQEIAQSTKAIEATSDNTHSSELVSEEKDQTPKLVEEIHEEEKEEAHKLQAEEIFPIEITPRESSDEALASMLASKEDEKVTLQEDICADDVRETKDTQDERSVSVETEESVGETKPKEPEDDHVETPTSPIISEKNDNKTLIAEAKKGDEDINETETTMDLEESKEEKSQEILETTEAKEVTSDQILPIETSQEDQTLSYELVSRVDDQTPRHVEEIHEEETKEECKFEAIVDQSLPVETSQEDQTPSSELASELDDQTPKQFDEEETKEEHKLQVEVDQILPVKTSQEDQTPSLVKEILEEETKETHKVEADDTVPRESFSEAPVSVLASGEDEPVTLHKSKYAGDDIQEERLVSAEIEEKVVETKPKEPEVEETEKSEDQVETSTKLTEIEDENTKKTDIEEAEQEDENSSTLPVVEILKELHQLPLETERELNDSADQEQKKGDAEVESNEKYSASDIIEEVKVQDGISREFEVNVEETREIAESKEEVSADLSLTELLPVVKMLSCEKQEEDESQEDVNASISEKISLQEEQKEKNAETHETVKEEDEIFENKEEKKSEEKQDEKLWDSSATKDIEEIFLSEVKDDKEVHSVLGSEEEINEVVISEKQITDPVGVIMKASEAEQESNEEHIETQVIYDDRDLTTEQTQEDQRDEVSDDKSLTKEVLSEHIQVPSSTVLDDRDLSVEKPSELIQSHQSPNLPLEEKVEETSFEVKAQEEKNANALITDKSVQVQDQSKDFEAPTEDKETSEQEHKSNDPTDIKQDNDGTDVKLKVHDDEVRFDSHDSVVTLKEETGLIEVEHVKTELEDAIKHGVSVEEKNNTSEKLDRDAAKEISQEESNQTCTVKEEIKEEEKETNQECFKKTDDGIEKTQTETRDIKTQDKPEQKYEVPNQKTREIAVEVPKIAEELKQKDGESENKNDLFPEVKESEPTEKEPARKSLSNLIQKAKGTTKNEDTTTEPHIEEKLKTEEDNEDEHNKDDKTSPDSLVMVEVEAKDTVSIIKTHKKSQGILSGVGSKVKHSISKVKKVLTGKSSHTTKPSSPK